MVTLCLPRLLLTGAVFLVLLEVLTVHSLRIQEQLPLQSMASNRVQLTEAPHIENVLDRYAALPGLTLLALGSSHWTPPTEALQAIQREVFAADSHRYGSILGHPPLREALLRVLRRKGLDTSGQDILITAGANQAITSISLALCDGGDEAILLSPYYFSQLLALQLCQCQVTIAPFDRNTLEPCWDELEALAREKRPKVVFLTSPSNPSGHVFSQEKIDRLVQICREVNAWLVVDETYYEFLYDHDAQHAFPTGYEKIVHIFSLSKVFGMPGWRVGYLVYPAMLTDQLRKIQDTVPTHANMLAQKLAYQCIRQTYLEDDVNANDSDNGNGPGLRNPWFEEHLRSLVTVREALWPVLAPLGTVRTSGAFYFLVPLPDQVTEEEAVDILARQFGVLLMYGKCFGAPGHLRLSYGSIPPKDVLTAIKKLEDGFSFLQQLSRERS